MLVEHSFDMRSLQCVRLEHLRRSNQDVGRGSEVMLRSISMLTVYIRYFPRANIEVKSRCARFASFSRPVTSPVHRAYTSHLVASDSYTLPCLLPRLLQDRRSDKRFTLTPGLAPRRLASNLNARSTARRIVHSFWVVQLSLRIKNISCQPGDQIEHCIRVYLVSTDHLSQLHTLRHH